MSHQGRFLHGAHIWHICVCVCVLKKNSRPVWEIPTVLLFNLIPKTQHHIKALHGSREHPVWVPAKNNTGCAVTVRCFLLSLCGQRSENWSIKDLWYQTSYFILRQRKLLLFLKAGATIFELFQNTSQILPLENYIIISKLAFDLTYYYKM